jgi:uncharacterized protein with PhoU and TrkA domain
MIGLSMWELLATTATEKSERTNTVIKQAKAMKHATDAACAIAITAPARESRFDA